jgi:hypothetical protein
MRLQEGRAPVFKWDAEKPGSIDDGARRVGKREASGASISINGQGREIQRTDGEEEGREWEGGNALAAGSGLVLGPIGS